MASGQSASLPFKVGQLAESKTFIPGFRGAWFRCRIKDIAWKRGQIRHALKYIDFPGEKIEWIKLYEKPPFLTSKSNAKQMEIMERPPFPRVFKESELPGIDKIHGITVVVNDAWKVGDLVDWLADGCFWSGTITEVLNEDKVQVELLPPPLGEGDSYAVCCKDLRPSLDWSPKVGWTVPSPKDPGSGRCARIIRPADQEVLMMGDTNVAKRGVRARSRSPVELNASTSDKSEQLRTRGMPEQASSESDSKEETDAPAMGLQASRGCSSVGLEGLQLSGSSKKMRVGAGSCWCSDSLEGSIMDLEELVNKVKWLEGILESGNTRGIRPPWRFLHQAPAHRA